MKLLIDQEDAQNILNYLLEQPAKEVIGFIATMQRLEEAVLPVPEKLEVT